MDELNTLAFFLLHRVRNASFPSEWRGRYRSWIQSNVPRGDTLTWSSTTMVSVPFLKLGDLAEHAAGHAMLGEYQRSLSTLNSVLELNSDLTSEQRKGILSAYRSRMVAPAQDPVQDDYVI